jgi:glycosyltransferase involved in cell wall biosynthesis
VRIVFVSRLILRKGLQFLIEAIPDIRKQVSNPFVIKVIGDGPDKEKFLQQIEHLGVSEHFKFYGYVEHDKLPEYYLDADVFILPSLAEGMPNVVLEAMGSGLPIVATRVAGSEELVQHGENGFLVAPKDVNAIAQALSTLINEKMLRERMGRRSKEIARQYTWEFVTEQYIVLYQQATKRQKAKGKG